MLAQPPPDRWPKESTLMRRAVILCGTVSFIMAFLGGALGSNLAAAPQAGAQSNQPQEVRASTFTLVAEDGTVLARLAPNEPPPGLRPVGQLTLNNASGTTRLTAMGGGIVTAYDQDG